MNIQKLIENEAQISIHVHPEDSSIKGYIDSGDPVADRQWELEVIAESQWNEWAWCVVEVKARWEGLSASAYLGGVVEKNEESFRANGYFDDLKHEAISELVEQVTKITQKVNQ